MAALSERKIEIVRTLVESAPDRVVGGLQKALEAASDPLLASVRQLVEIEAQDRRLRNAVLAPIAPMCVGDGTSASRLTFPVRALALIWRGLKAEASAEVEEAAALLADAKPEESAPEAFDRLAAFAATGVRARRSRDYDMAAVLCDKARPDGAAVLCACLDLAPLVRASTLRLGDWISRTTDENTAAVRVVYKDVVALADDAGPRFFEMLAAQLAQPWMVLRIISAEMDRPTDKYLADSELASFALRLMDEVDANLATVSKMDLDGGEGSSRATARVVETITLQIAELEHDIEINREGPWGARIARHKQSLAGVVEALLREAEKAVTAALPVQAVRARVPRTEPLIVAEPDARAVNRAMTLLHFSYQIRGSANYGGFASARAKVVEKLLENLDKYVEDVLHSIRCGEVEDELAGKFLAVVADFNALLRDEKAAEIVRRRAAAALAAEKLKPTGTD